MKFLFHCSLNLRMRAATKQMCSASPIHDAIPWGARNARWLMTKSRWWMPVVLAALCAAAYHNTFHVPFIFDDLVSITRNPAIRRLWPLSDVMVTNIPALLGRPLVSLSLAVNYALGGYRVEGYHLFNLIVHFLNTMLVFAIVRHTLTNAGSPDAAPGETTSLAYAVAGLWMVHPLATEAVTYVVSRTELLMALFLLLTLYCFIRGLASPSRGVWFGLAIVACVLGMGAKEVMVVAPLLVLAYDYIFADSSLRTAVRTRPGLYAGLTTSWAVLAALQLTTDLGWKTGLREMSMGPGDYFKMQGGVVVHYLRLAAWPRGLVLDYSDWPRTLLLASVLPKAGLLLALFTGSMWAIRRRAWWGFWGAWFFLLLAPSSSFLPLPTEPAAERRMYLPLLAVITVSVGGAHHLCRSLWTRFGWPGRARVWTQTSVVAALALALCVATIQRNAQYRSAKSIWADVVAKRPGSVRGHANLGLALLDEGRATESIPHFVDALRIDPDQPIVRCNLAAALAASGAVEQGIAQLQETLRHAPHCAPAHAALADLLADRDEPKPALEHYGAALAINPNDQVAHFNLALLLTRMGQREQAVTQYAEVVRLDPRNATAHYNLANLLAESGRDTEAISHYTAAARLDPRNARSQINLGNVLLKQGHLDDAINAYADALRADPRAFEAHSNLAIALANRGDLVGAAGHFREAARLRPELPEAHSALAEVLERQGLYAEARRQLAEAHRLMDVSGTH
jgi:tetratricopeptide (TPR) repeat protein